MTSRARNLKSPDSKSAESLFLKNYRPPSFRALVTLLLREEPIDKSAWSLAVLEAWKAETTTYLWHDDDIVQAGQHLFCRDLRDFVKAEEVAALLDDQGCAWLARGLVESARKIISPVLECVHESETPSIKLLPVQQLPCSGCNTPYDAVGHDCQGSDAHQAKTRRCHFPDNYVGGEEIRVAIHRGQLLLQLVSSVLGWPLESLKTTQFRLVDQLVKEGTQSLDVLLELFDTCVIIFPKVAHSVVGILASVVARRPVASLGQLDCQKLVRVVNRYLFKVNHRIISDCTIEVLFGVVQLANAFPLLYYMKEFRDPEVLRKGNLCRTLASLAINSMNIALTDSLKEMTFNYDEYPELSDAVLVVAPVLSATAAKMVRTHPIRFVAAGVIEVLARWQLRGIFVSGVLASEQDNLDELGGKLSNVARKQKKPLSHYFRRYAGPVIKIGDRVPEYWYVPRLLMMLALLTSPSLPEAHKSPEASLHAGLSRAIERCAMPSCFATVAAGSGARLLRCCGGCRGLGRYCCREHQIKDWPSHSMFCQRGRSSTKRKKVSAKSDRSAKAVTELADMHTTSVEQRVEADEAEQRESLAEDSAKVHEEKPGEAHHALVRAESIAETAESSLALNAVRRESLAEDSAVQSKVDEGKLDESHHALIRAVSIVEAAESSLALNAEAQKSAPQARFKVFQVHTLRMLDARAPADIEVRPVTTWPSCSHDEIVFLKEEPWSWKTPSGLHFASAKAPQPDLYMFYDAGDTNSNVNELAERIDQGVAGYLKAESALAQPQGSDGRHRGIIIVQSCPTVSSTFRLSSSVDYTDCAYMEDVGTDDSQSPLFTVREMQEMLFFFWDKAAVIAKLHRMESGIGRMLGDTEC